jgi:hypothetical protein
MTVIMFTFERGNVGVVAFADFARVACMIKNNNCPESQNYHGGVTE